MVMRRQISRLVKRIVEQFHPQKIILFGSYAYGKPTEDSDVDLLVVLPVRGRPVHKAAEIYSALDATGGVPFPMDLLVRTPQQIKQRVAMDDFFLREVTEQGKVMYEAF